MKTHKKKDQIRKPLRIGVVAPAGPADIHALRKNIDRLERSAGKGRVDCVVHPFIKEKPDFVFSSTDDGRAISLMEYLVDPSLDIVWSARGGYGSIRILPLLDGLRGIPIENAKEKIFVGYSDATLLLGYLKKHFGIRAVHGPMAATKQLALFSPALRNSFFKALIQRFLYGQTIALDPLTETLPEKKGSIRGTLKGGNLTTLVSSIGTPYLDDFKNAILFLEEVSEPVYKLDRMLEQAILAQSFKGIKAVWLGSFADCGDTPPMGFNGKPIRSAIANRMALHEFGYRLADAFQVPVFFGGTIGHGAKDAGWFEYGKEAQITWDQKKSKITL